MRPLLLSIKKTHPPPTQVDVFFGFSGGDIGVALCIQGLEHEAHGRQFSALHHGENSGAAAADQRHTFLVDRDRLLGVAALDVPEYHTGQLVACRSEFRLSSFEVGGIGIVSSAISCCFGPSGRHTRST